jgi:hypothetical protein
MLLLGQQLATQRRSAACSAAEVNAAHILHA